MKRMSLTIAFLIMTTGLVLAQEMPGSHFMENWDINEDGVLSLEDAMEKRSDVFVMFDMDENGSLSAEEYKLFDQTRNEDMEQNAGGRIGHGNRAMENVQKGLLLTFNDVDGDGNVTKEEFVGCSQDWMEMLDRNGDGIVTSKDFGPQ